MQWMTKLLLMTDDMPDQAIKAMAEAAVPTQTHLSCLLLQSMPVLPVQSYGVPLYGGINVPDDWGQLVDETRKAQTDRVQRVEAILSATGVSGDVQGALCTLGEIRHIVARRARLCDVALICNDMRDRPDVMREAAHGVLFQSPIGLMLNGSGMAAPERIFVAWDSSPAAAKAIHVALPSLVEAKEVVIACFDPVTTAGRDGADPGTDVAAWLSHHQCNVTVSQYPSGGQEVAQCIQDRAMGQGADLVVMGAYGHSRMIEAVFGGTTRSMMEHAKIPILLAH